MTPAPPNLLPGLALGILLALAASATQDAAPDGQAAVAAAREALARCAVDLEAIPDRRARAEAYREVVAARARLRALGAPAVPVLLEGLRQGARGVRENSALLLGSIGDTRTHQALADALGDEDRRVRLAAVRACGRLCAPESLSPLCALAVGPDPELRQAAAWALGELGDPRAGEVLGRVLADEVPAVRAAAVAALARVAGRDGLAAITDRILDGHARVRRAACEALARLADPRSAEALLALIAAPDGRVASAAAVGLEAIAGLRPEGESPAAAWRAWWERARGGLPPQVLPSPPGDE